MRGLLALVLVLMPGVAAALSCVPPNPGRELNVNAEKGRPTVVVAGTLLPPDHKPRRKGHATVTIHYRLEGLRLSGDGEDAPFDAGVDYQSDCVATWCGPLPETATEGLFLLRDRGEGWYLLITGPCPFGHYGVQTDDQLDALRTCLAAGRCGEDELERLRYRYR